MENRQPASGYGVALLCGPAANDTAPFFFNRYGEALIKRWLDSEQELREIAVRFDKTLAGPRAGERGVQRGG